MSKTEYKRLGDYIREVNVRNRDLKVTNLLGVSISKKFMPSIANTIGTDMSTYKIVGRRQFAYGPVTSRNGDKVSIALLGDYDNAIISQAYTVFEVIDHEQLLPEYLMMWFRRPEFAATPVSILMEVLVRYSIGTNFVMSCSPSPPSLVNVKSCQNTKR